MQHLLSSETFGVKGESRTLEAERCNRESIPAGRPLHHNGVCPGETKVAHPS